MATSIAEAVLQGSHKLRKAGVPEARREAGSLLANILGRDRSFIISHAEDEISQQHVERFRDFLDWRARGKPLQYITGQQEFFGLEFEVTRDVLIPRSETELLVETAVKLLNSDSSICDVGTGSGCIAITLVHQLPQAEATAVDVSVEALEVAKRNAARHAVADRIDFVVSDCFVALAQMNTRPLFDLVVSNPPYVADSAMEGLQREVRDFEPRVALAGGADGLTIIRRLLIEAEDFLKPAGHLLFEIGFDQHAAVEQLIDPRVWKLLDIHQDLQGIPRTVALQKIE